MSISTFAGTAKDSGYPTICVGSNSALPIGWGELELKSSTYISPNRSLRDGARQDASAQVVSSKRSLERPTAMDQKRGAVRTTCRPCRLWVNRVDLAMSELLPLFP